MQVKDVLNKYHYCDGFKFFNGGKIERLKIENYAIFFPAGDNIHQSKKFNIDFLEPIELKYPKIGVIPPNNYTSQHFDFINLNYAELVDIPIENLTVITYKKMNKCTMKKTIFKHRRWSYNDDVAFADAQWLCILVENIKI